MIKVNIKTLTGQTHILQIQLNNSTIQVKQKIQELIGIPVQQQRLIFQGKQIQDNRLINDYNIKDGSLIHLILRLRKPVVLLYNYKPFQQVQVRIQIQKQNIKFSSVYPQPKAFDLSDTTVNWNVQFIQNGKLQLCDNSRYYPYLFYECFYGNQRDLKEFICIKRQDIESRLDVILETMGLNYSERCDMITYWMPTLSIKKYVKIGFINNYDDMVSIAVKPMPQILLRIIMVFQGIDQYQQSNLNVQTFSLDRNKLKTVVQWGGIQLF